MKQFWLHLAGRNTIWMSDQTTDDVHHVMSKIVKVSYSCSEFISIFKCSLPQSKSFMIYDYFAAAHFNLLVGKNIFVLAFFTSTGRGHLTATIE